MIVWCNKLNKWTIYKELNDILSDLWSGFLTNNFLVLHKDLI